MVFRFIATVVILVAIAIVTQLLYYRKKSKDSLVELNANFCLSENTDQLLDTYKEQTGLTIDGIIGNDFMVSNDYIIDYENLVIRHKTVKISIKDSMDIVEIPLIILYQDARKYIFMLDTGATSSTMHSRCLKEGLIYEESDDDEIEIYGFGGCGMSARTISVNLYYSKKRHTK